MYEVVGCECWRKQHGQPQGCSHSQLCSRGEEMGTALPPCKLVRTHNSQMRGYQARDLLGVRH